MPGLVLMENAGRGIVDFMRREGLTGPVLIACGPGNNGGDGYVIARHLDLLGLEVHVVLACRARAIAAAMPAKTSAGSQATDVRIRTLGSSMADAPTVALVPFDWVVDALLGTGVRGAPGRRSTTLIRRLNQLPARRLAVDLPSGLGRREWRCRRRRHFAPI